MRNGKIETRRTFWTNEGHYHRWDKNYLTIFVILLLI